MRTRFDGLIRQQTWKEDNTMNKQLQTTSAKSARDGHPLSRLDAAGTSMNIQAGLSFKLIGTSLMAMFARVDGKNTFLVIPTEKNGTEGMSIKEIVSEINNLLKGVDPNVSGLDAKALEESIKDVGEAGRKQEGTKPAFDPASIKVCLKQAFLLLSPGNAVEYAIQLHVDCSSIFPEGQSFFNVEQLSLAVWNTDRVKILSRMEIVDIPTYLNENA